MTFNTMAQIVDFEEVRRHKPSRNNYCAVCGKSMYNEPAVITSGKTVCLHCNDLVKKQFVVMFSRFEGTYGGAA